MVIEQNKWYSLEKTIPSEPELPIDRIVEVTGHRDEGIVERARFASGVGDWLGISGDPTHWRYFDNPNLPENDEEYLLFAGDGGVPEVMYTLEGEGPLVGRPSIFLRFFGCNLTCKGFKSDDSPNGCDSYISWSVKNKLSFNETFNLLESKCFIERLKAGAVMKITGGEPFLRQEQLLKFVRHFGNRYGFIPEIDFETNATIMPDERWVTEFDATFTTSPKLSTNGDPESKTYKPEVLRWHAMNRSAFKFVITRSEDIDEIWRKYVNDKEGINVDTSRIWFMPCAGSREEHIERAPAVAEYAKQMSVNFSPRLHLLLWDKCLRV